MPTNDDDVQIVAFHLVVKFDDSYKEDRIVADSSRKDALNDSCPKIRPVYIRIDYGEE